MPLWLKEKLFQKKLLKDELKEQAPEFDWETRLLFGEHHQSHAASAFFPSPFPSAAILTVDGVGEEALAILQDLLGVRPAGYRSPSWDVNVWTPALLKTHGFLYDSSLMGNDVPYTLDTPAGPLTEVPVQWIMDDAPLFRHVYGATNAIADPGRVLQMWSKEFVAMHRENGCFVLTCHPFISGRASRAQLIEDLVRFMRRQTGVWFTTCAEVARWHAETHPAANRPPALPAR